MRAFYPCPVWLVSERKPNHQDCFFLLLLLMLLWTWNISLEHWYAVCWGKRPPQLARWRCLGLKEEEISFNFQVDHKN